MSHVVTMKTSFKDMNALKAAAEKRKVGLTIAEKGKTIARKLYQGMVDGIAALQLKGWKYEAMVQADGSCKADNFNGSWGKQEEMDGFAQEYGVQLATQTLENQGYRYTEETVDAEGARELVFVS